MCGIAGIYAYTQNAPPVDQSCLRRIQKSMLSRGPDADGLWLNPTQSVGLAHRRLAIIDIGAQGNQPMHSADGRHTIVFNGEIYNYRELRRRLEAGGARFATASDTEVLLQLYAAYGEDMLPMLRGMYAFGLWDAERQGLWLARDPYGIKPLYYADDGKHLRFASQVKALIAAGAGGQPDPAGITGFFLFGCVPEPYTLTRDIRALPAGTSLWVRQGRIGVPKRHFHLAEILCAARADPEPLDEAGLQDAVAEAIRDCVQHHLVADVPVGAFLSAGVDSTALVALMRDCDGREIDTITLAFQEFSGSRLDETAAAAASAKFYATRHTARHVGPAEFRADLPHILQDMDQPSVDGINTWYVSKAAAEQGLKVVLSGLGGDELFGGYATFNTVPQWQRLLGWSRHTPGVGRLLRGLAAPLLNILPSRAASPKLAGLLEYGGSYAGAYLLNRALFLPWELPGLVDRDLARQGLAQLDAMGYLRGLIDPDPGGGWASVAALEAGHYMGNQLLRDSDWASMAHSLELRVPLVDHVLLERLAPMLAAQANINGKRLLAGSPRRPLPESIVTRAKTGFEIPLGAWLDRAGQARLPKSVNWGRYWTRRWSYQLMAQWPGMKQCLVSP